MGASSFRTLVRTTAEKKWWCQGWPEPPLALQLFALSSQANFLLRFLATTICVFPQRQLIAERALSPVATNTIIATALSATQPS